MTAATAPPEHLSLVTHDIIGAAIEVHRCLGPGLLESVYLECVCHELRMRSVVFDHEILLPLQYKGLRLNHNYRLDLVLRSGIVRIAN
jgi:GxxExxY protein